ncbi:hypothetical protein [Neogemmobacter tilapiae]|uniref:Type VI secretion system effector TseH-like domain-containing protein n=1 Tax=Neogemmobacter tilapiae TaxID=875041 RepID=A0A918WHR5_9RHOB|nr:hypothetical protein [Gemmobacter tilapiae]GHC52722.1 hypothetical protein GCM10007315_14100 [Gemmobacter tilapiae]
MTDFAVIVTWPQYPIATSAGHVSGLGHAGVVLVNGASGETKYFEYGRYDKDENGNPIGAVRSVGVSNLSIVDGAITQASFEKMMLNLSHSSGKNTLASGSILPLSEGGFNSALEFAKLAKADPTGVLGDYALVLDENTCYSFAKAVAAAGGSWVEWKDGFFIFDNVPAAAIVELQASAGAFVIGGPNDSRIYIGISSSILRLEEDKCFLAATPISMWDGTTKPIELVEAGDIVVSYDKDGHLKPGRVKRTMINRAKQILDVHGLMVTPGHATLCGDGRYAGQHVPILDILRSDGALVLQDGSKIRAGTGCRLGTMGDRMITAIIGVPQPGGLVRIAEIGQIRAGTRFIKEDGEDVAVLDMILEHGGHLTEEGMIQTDPNGPKMPFRWTFTATLPKPEDYVLQRSATHLQDIYKAGEWESFRPSMPRPRAEAKVEDCSDIAAAPANVPLAMRNHPEAPQVNRRYRRVAKANARKAQVLLH